ncbi:hypothetical protein [Methylobacterium aquaticum]|uniref:Uncharacterized protein n=1 Tax=Methylobacterium aquaticum TaxID=270351 RepID=A0A0C6FPX3_9HYPH|nr:hypothetical protein [Methylobacterium aquaticum]BAQ50338.1 hypothetical protein Maq22A_3p50440 [Methylobacterium aquaticum]
MAYRLRVADPRDITGDHMLDVEYGAYIGPSDMAVGWPGTVTIDIYSAVTKRGACVVEKLTQPELNKLEASIDARHEFDD